MRRKELAEERRERADDLEAPSADDSFQEDCRSRSVWDANDVVPALPFRSLSQRLRVSACPPLFSQLSTLNPQLPPRPRGLDGDVAENGPFIAPRRETSPQTQLSPVPISPGML